MPPNEFPGNYWTSMDRDHYASSFAAIENPGYMKSSTDYSLRSIGSPRWLQGQTTNPIKAVMGDIRGGAGHIELTAPGTGKGGQGSPTFEEVDAQQRQELIDIQKAIDDVTITTHATPAIWGLSGYDARSGNFDDQNRSTGIKEIQKAIDFASEATFGGSVVIHTGEFQRPLYNIPGQQGVFESFSDEQNQATYLVVDPHQRKIAGGIREDMDIYLPVKKTQIVNGKPQVVYLKDEDGKDYVDPISQERVPVYEKRKDSEDIEFKKYTFKDFVQKQIEENSEKIKEYVTSQGGDPSDISADNVYVKEAVAREFAIEQNQAQISSSLMNARQYLQMLTEGQRQRDKILQEIELYKKLKEQLTPDQYKQYMKQRTDRFGRPVDDELIDPIELKREELRENDRNIAMGREANLSAQRQVLELRDRVKDFKTVREYALNKSFDSYAQLGMYAYDKTQSLKQKYEGSDFEHKVKPIFLTLENLYPEGGAGNGYGSDVTELIHLVEKSRSVMAQKLQQQRGINAHEAKKIADRHIKATFDTGHFNMWRKYFKRNPGESEDTFTKRYNSWYVEQVEKLAKSGIIGNVHLADNFGYDDTHLAPGEGNTPIKEVMGVLKKYGYNEKFAVEGGFNQGKSGFVETWKHLGNAIHRQTAGTQAWTDVGASFSTVRDSYHGLRQRPYFLFGQYAPQNDDWKPWSGSSME